MKNSTDLSSTASANYAKILLTPRNPDSLPLHRILWLKPVVARYFHAVS